MACVCKCVAIAVREFNVKELAIEELGDLYDCSWAIEYGRAKFAARGWGTGPVVFAR